MATKFCAVVPNIFESSVWYLHHVTLLAPRIFRWLLGFWKFYAIRVKTNGVSISVLIRRFVFEAKRTSTSTSLSFMLQCGHYVSARTRNSEAALVIQLGVLRCEGFMKLLYLTHMYSRSGRVG
jgi:hypothetical protein